MSQKKNAKNKQSKHVQGKNNLTKPTHIDFEQNSDDGPSKKRPDIDRLVDDIILKYNDFGITDRDVDA